MFQPEEYEYLLHEIKNYICVINGSLQLITKQHPEVREFRHWDEILSDAEHLSKMCREFSVSHFHAQIQRQPVAPTEFFCSLENEIIGMLGSNEIPDSSGWSNSFELPDTSGLQEKIETPDTGISFSMNIFPNLPEMEIDPIQIKHALINLIKNASEAISGNGNIILSAFANADQLYIQLQDDGIGMNAEQLDKIFLPAYTTKTTGTGIGLFITKTIIEAHDGSIRCQSEQGKGTTFIITLPLCNTKVPLI